MGPISKRVAVIIAVAAFAALPAFADTFTSSSSFNSAISGMSGVTTASFDTDTPGDIAQGATVDGITFNYNIDGGLGSLAISNLFDTTSGTNYLGSDDPTTGALFPGDSITMSFASPVNALGLFIIGGPYSDGDFTLDIGTDTALSSSVLEETLGDGGEVIFLGITSTTGFSSATLSLDSGAFELWNVDDITTAGGTPGTGGGGVPTPEPSTVVLLAAGLAVCARRARKLRAAQAGLFS
ncbi:MAG TPA: PEP-CTERM sorting domain-containing protein [Candidatus Acidoferrum sp.]|nr:PEP-CTERM sorting domain-containing protein [Candidatus Acidoferrum sp.]